MKKVTLIAVITLAMIFFTGTFMSATDIGDFTIVAANGTDVIVEGTDYTYTDGVLTVSTTTPIIIGMKNGVVTTADSIYINTQGGSACITLNNIGIETAKKNAILVEGGNGCVLTVLGTNNIKSTYSYGSAIRLSGATTAITVNGTGILNAYNTGSNGAVYAATQGDGSFTVEGDVTLNVNASGGAAIQYFGLTTIQGNAKVNLTPASSADGINPRSGSQGVIIGGNSQVTVNGGEAGIYCNISANNQVIIKDSAKLTVTNTTKYGIYTTNSAAAICIEDNAIVNITTGGHGIFNSDGQRIEISDNAQVKIESYNNGLTYGLRAKDGTVTVNGNAKVTINGASTTGINGASGVNISGKAVVSVTDSATGISAGRNNNFNISNSASVKIEATNKVIYANSVLIVTPDSGKTYKLVSGESSVTADTYYYTAETTVPKENYKSSLFLSVGIDGQETAVTEFTVNVSASPADGGTVSGGGKYEQNKTATVVAVATDGYKFVGWTENNSTVSTAESYSFTVLSDRTLVAVFEKEITSEALYQTEANGEWKDGSFVDAVANVYSGGTVKLLKDVIISQTVSITKSMTITSNDTTSPKTITSNTDNHGYLLNIVGSFASDGETYTPANVTMTNVIVDGGSKSNITATRALIGVGNNSNLSFKAGYLTLGTGAVIRNNNNVTENGAGGGVCVIVGGLTVSEGQIIGNTAYSGGGVAIVNSKNNYVTLNSGSISDNKATNNGGGIYQSAGTVTVNGGNIKNNEAVKYGGGAYICTSASTFKLDGGTVSENRAKYGAGIYVNDGMLLELSGGSVTGNVAEKWGAGLLVAPDITVNISGSVKIYDNTNTSGEEGSGLYLDGYIYNGVTYMPTVKVGALDSSAKIEAYTWLKPEDGKVLLIGVPSDGYTVSAADVSLLNYESVYYTFVLQEGNVVLTKATPLTGTVTVSGREEYNETLTATVSGSSDQASLIYTWKRGDTTVGTGASYKITSADIGSTLTVEITSSKETGKLSATTGVINKAAITVKQLIEKESWNPYFSIDTYDLSDMFSVTRADGTDFYISRCNVVFYDINNAPLDYPIVDSGVYTVKISLSTGDQSNYILDKDTFTYTVDPLDITGAVVTFTMVNPVYSGDVEFPARTESGKLSIGVRTDDYYSLGDIDKGLWRFEAIEGKNNTEAGEAYVNIVGNSKNVIGSYEYKYRIKGAPITVTADAKTKVYGKADPEFTWEITEGALIGDDELSGELTRKEGERVGSYAIEQGTLSHSNYSITFVSADLTVTPKEISVSKVEITDKIYDETAVGELKDIEFAVLIGDDKLREGRDYDVTVTFEDAKISDNKNVTVTIVLKDSYIGRNYQLAESTVSAIGNIIPGETDAPVVSLVEGKIYCLGADFTVTDANTFTVTLNGETIDAVDGVYHVEPAEGEQTVVVTDYFFNTTTVTFTVNGVHEYGPSYLQGPPHCDRDMIKIATCKHCGHKIYDIAYGTAMGHVTHIEYNESGHWESCSRCFREFTVNAHTEGEWIVDKAATVFEKGLKHTECTVCGYVMRTEEIPTVFICGHAETTLSGVKAATCTEDGYSGDTVCVRCGKIIVDGEVIPATGHAVDKWVITDDTHCLICATDGKVIEGSIASHTDTDYDGKCDFCEYEMGTKADIDEPGAYDNAETATSLMTLLLSALAVTAYTVFSRKIKE